MALDFEQPVLELEQKIAELRHLTSDDTVNISTEIHQLEKKVAKLLANIYSDLTPWQKVKVARHPDRPQYFDYLTLFDNFVPLSGDRLFAEDPAIIGGLARFADRAVMVMGQQKGRDTEARLYHNFGMPRPEGYRKAQRLMKLAEQFRLPLITFIDTAGAYPGIDAEERGQAEAIAQCIDLSLDLTVPVISIVIGEGGSGGAIAIGVANTVLMLEHAVYSVISPEGCATILWRDVTKAPDAAEAQKLTAQDLLKLNVIDEIITEPVGGAHRHHQSTIQQVGEAIKRHLLTLERKGGDLRIHRYDKFMMTSIFEVNN